MILYPFLIFSSIICLVASKIGGSNTTTTSTKSSPPIISCANGGRTLDIPSGSTATIRLALSPPGTLCTLTVIQGDNTIIPVGRSYDSNDWEAAAGTYNTLEYRCEKIACEVTLPQSNYENHTFQLDTFEHSLSIRDEIARFFEQATFGARLEDLKKMENEAGADIDLIPSFVRWTHDQIYEEQETSHREFWRERLMPEHSVAGREGRANIFPCEKGSYWRRFALTKMDRNKHLEIKLIGEHYSFSVDGKFRTIVNRFRVKNNSFGIDSFPLSMKICEVQAYTYGKIGLIDYNGRCNRLIGGNPPININGMNPQPTVINGISMLESVERRGRIEKMTLQDFSTSDGCTFANDQPKFINIPYKNSTETMIFEPRLVLLENTIINPVPDGGGSIMEEIGGEEAQCSNVPRTFLNENHCKLSLQESTCAPAEFIEGSVKLTPVNIKKFWTVEARKWQSYVYAVSNLRLEDDNAVESPCVHGVKTRWEKNTSSSLCISNVGERTANIFRDLINKSEDPNPNLKDLVTPSSASCASADENTLQMIVQVGEECWKTVHPNHLNVYDFTEWKDTHPGSKTNPQSIKQFAQNDSHILLYPASHAMLRWKDRYQEFPYLGRLGDEIEFKNFPDTLRNGFIAKIFGLTAPNTNIGTKVVVCGSVNEVGSKLFPNSFSMIRPEESDIYNVHEFGQQRRTVFTMVALSASDQLRQRVAWALSQLLVISPSFINSPSQTESFLTYYDIFVRNGFGNYFDILKEVSYSPMMAEMLSYLGSKSSEYIWKAHKEVQFADENYAREIMQLFSIGLVKLNIDGTEELDSNGNTIATYTNDDITEYARVWTGFRMQQQRGNTEERKLDVNSIDPMSIYIPWRDQLPKMGLDKYIGDLYPSCSDLPRNSFLQKNSKYRLLGKSTISDIQNISPSDIHTLDTSSLLLRKLCQPNVNGVCSYPGVIYLDEDISCTGIECNLSFPKALHVGNNVHYEYIKPPCINFPFTANNNLVIVIDSNGKVAIERDNASTDNYHSLTYFRVEWRNGRFPNVDNRCGYRSCQEVDGRCRCRTTVEEDRVFSSVPSRNDILSQLSIGALPPKLYEYDAEESYESFKLYSPNKAHMFRKSSVFEVKDDFGRMLHLKNLKSTVTILKWGEKKASSFQFRNTPLFYTDTPEVINAIHETDAALEHYFYHQNTAPFVAIRLIQRFGISNPTKRFVKKVAEAFKSGHYEVPYRTGLPSFGTGKYGDLSATIAAILLDRESRNVVLDSDSSSGGIREPIIKVISIMRSLNYIQTSANFISLHNLQPFVGQGPHDMPSVFSFFLPEYAPPGILSQASLVAPEAMVLQNSIGLVNGVISLIKYGLSACDGGFGGQKGCKWKNGEPMGHLSYSQGNETDITKIVDDLATLLTSGRLSKSQREIIGQAYMKESDKTEALRLAQKLTILSPEHHVTGLIKKSSEKRPELPAPTKTCQEYKAVIHILLEGGCDSYNMLVPHSQCQEKDMYDEYKAARGSVGLSKETLLPIDAHDSDQVCDVFGIHPHLPLIKELYDEKEALFFSGIGVLSEPVTRDDYEMKTRTQLFAHNAIQAEISRLDPYMVSTNTGTLGRLADVLSTKYNTNAFAIDTSLAALEGNKTEVLKVAVNSLVGFQKFNPSASDEENDPVKSHFDWINAEQVAGSSNFFGQTWSSSVHKSVLLSGRLNDARNSIQLKEAYPDTQIGRQLKAVSNVIASHDCRGSSRDIFYIETGGFDHHANVMKGLSYEFDLLNGGLTAFVNEMKGLPDKMWDKVTVVVSSDFGRTLRPNSGGGTDHGWSGTTFALGGSIKGGRIMGQYPDDLTGPLNLGRGRLIPTLPFEAPWNAVIQWLGVKSNDDLDRILPNRKSFPGMMLSHEQVFTKRRCGNRVQQCKGEGKEVFCRDKNLNNGGGGAGDDNDGGDDRFNNYHRYDCEEVDLVTNKDEDLDGDDDNHNQTDENNDDYIVGISISSVVIVFVVMVAGRLTSAYAKEKKIEDVEEETTEKQDLKVISQKEVIEVVLET